MLPNTGPFDLDGINTYTEKAVGYPIYAYWELFLPKSGVELMESNLEGMWVGMHGDRPDWMKKMFCTRGAFEKFLRDRESVEVKGYAEEGTKLKEDWISGIKKHGFVLLPLRLFKLTFL